MLMELVPSAEWERWKRLCLAAIEKKDLVRNLELWEDELICESPGFRMVSCGHDNIRLWRVRNGTLRSCPVNLGEYHSLDFTDVAFGELDSSNQQLDDRTLWVSKQVTETIWVYLALEEVCI